MMPARYDLREPGKGNADIFQDYRYNGKEYLTCGMKPGTGNPGLPPAAGHRPVRRAAEMTIIR